MPPKKKLVGEEGDFLWTNNEIEILLGTVRGFKAEKEREVINWESIKDKYERIRYNFFLMREKGGIPTQRYSFYMRTYCFQNRTTPFRL